MADPCEVAHYIYLSQTCCYAKDRRRALYKLGHKFDCVCNPEIMCAFVYGLNDADERVREQAAVEIARQTKKNPCCCNEHITAALTCALSDCDRGVRRKAEKALCVCGYDVQDCNVSCGSCNSCTTKGCGPAAVPAHTEPAAAAPVDGGETAPAPAPAPEAAPAPAPAASEPEAYFPSRLKSSQNRSHRSSLSNLFGLLN